MPKAKNKGKTNAGKSTTAPKKDLQVLEPVVEAKLAENVTTQEDIVQDRTETLTRDSSDKIKSGRELPRDEKVREPSFAPFKPRSKQEIPVEVSKAFLNKGFKLHWTRVSLGGEFDAEQVSESLHRGFVPVEADELPSEFARTLEVRQVQMLGKCLAKIDTVLTKIPVDRYNEIRQYFENEANLQVQSVNQRLKENSAGSVINESKSDVVTSTDKARITEFSN